MRGFFICASGTAGHIFPALLIAEELKQKGIHQIHCIGTRRGMEGNLVTEAGYPIHFIRARGWDRSFGWSFFRMIFDNLIGFFQAFWLVAFQRPPGILAMGSYVSLLIAFWGRVFGVPLFLHEQNVLPGLANRIVARWARKIFISSDDSLAYFQNQDTIVLTGNPLRKTVTEWRGKTVEARARFGLDPDRYTVFVIGGSLGSSLINRVFFEVRSNWKGKPFQVLHATGQEEYQKYRRDIREPSGQYQVFDFLPDPGPAFAASDLVICRAGANTTFELDWFGIPAIMIPFEGATEDHQDLNAFWLQKRQPVEIIQEGDFNPLTLAIALEKMITRTEKPERASQLSQEPASVIAGAILEELQRKHPLKGVER